jgi:mycothiol synthase
MDVDGAPGVELAFVRRGDRTEVEVAGLTTGTANDPADPGVARTAAALAELADHPDLAGSTISLAADHPVDELDPRPEALAAAAGLAHHRDLLQLRRPLPVPADHPSRRPGAPLRTRPFDPTPSAGDRSAWIRANNRAFSLHPDQGHETEATLDARLGEPWFDPAGFLLVDDADRPGELAGSCWTKVHPATADEPALGEIYVIGVDPSQQGSGLGAALVLAGLDHLAGLGLATALLFVEADNEPALALYRRLGFEPHGRRRVYAP